MRTIEERVKLSERVNREFEKWQEEYEIPLGEEFQVKTLLKLQEEYDEINPDSGNTRTRETILSMIKSLHGSLRLNKKIKRDKPMYVNYIRTDNGDKVEIYMDWDLYIIKGKELSNIKNYALVIASLADSHKAIIYIDSHGYGKALLNELEQHEKLVVRELHYNYTFKDII